MNSILLSFCAALVINSFAEEKFLLVEIEENEGKYIFVTFESDLNFWPRKRLEGMP